jgi:PAS domain S-box-containing protein
MKAAISDFRDNQPTTHSMSAAVPIRRPIETSESSGGLLFESAPVGIAKCTDRGTITAVNPAWQRMHTRETESTPSTRFADLSLTDLIPEEDRSESLRLFQKMVKGDREGFQLEHRRFKTDGSTAWVRWIAWRVQNSQGEPICGLVMAEDITEHRNSEQRLRQAERLESVGRLAGGRGP